MKKNILVPLFFIMLVLALIYSIGNANKKIDNFFNLHKKIADVISINKNFDIFIANNIKYKNFDYIQDDISKSKKCLLLLKENELFKKINNNSLNKYFDIVEENMNIKINKIYKTISKVAVLNNSFRYLQNTPKDLSNKELLYIYTKIIGVNYDLDIDIPDLNKKINAFKINNKNEELFIAHSKILLQYHNSFNKLKEDIVSLKLNEKLNTFEKNFTNHSTLIIKDLKNVIWLLVILVFIALVVFLMNNHMIVKKQVELNRFKKAVQSSDNIILITDKNRKIKYVNEAFEKTTGYKLKEVLGQSPSFLKSYQKSESFYEDLNKTILSGQKWQGEFINKSKDGSITFEKASITPILDENGDIEEYLAIKLDITKEKETDELLKEKEKLLAQQSKMAAMREMLENIAHQWRQPLSTISTAASGITVNKEYDNLSDEKLAEYTDVIVENTQYLSNTIENFKNYFNTQNEVTTFNLKDTTNKVLDLVDYRLNESKCKVILNYEELIVEGFENEFIQSMINIINNSLEAFPKEVPTERFIFIDILKEANKVVLRIKDNAGGLNEDIIEHVFEPYFTTKHKSTGTGMGLFMVHEFIIKHFMGTIRIENTKFEYKNCKHKGSQIIIEIPSSLVNR